MRHLLLLLLLRVCVVLYRLLQPPGYRPASRPLVLP